jgi:hypothetical protein
MLMPIPLLHRRSPLAVAVLSMLVAAAAAALPTAAGGATTPFPTVPADALPVLHPEEVTLDVESTLGPQYLAADARGRLHLLRGDRPTFHTLTPDGQLHPWGDPERQRAFLETSAPNVLLDASLSPDGTWILLNPADVLVISPHETRTLPAPPWMPLAVALPDHPVAAVLPIIPRRVKPPGFDPDSPPLLLELTSSGWTPLVDGPFNAAERAAPPGHHTHRAFRALHLAPASAGAGGSRGLWAAHRYLYRLRRFSPAGRELLDLTLAPDPTPESLDDDTVDELRRTLADRAALLGEGDAVIRPFTARPTLEALTEGRDGAVYLYVAPGVFGPEPLLDRYDPVTHRLERAVLALDHPGQVTLAAGRHALWIAAVRGHHQLWRIPWSDLDQLPWQTVPGLHLNGAPVAP